MDTRQEAPAAGATADRAKLLHALRLDDSQREQQARAARWPWFAAAAAVLVAGAALAWWLLTTHATSVQLVAAIAPQAASSGAVLQATGYVTARRSATVSAQITGTVTRVLFDEGDRVRAGQVLAQLDSSQLGAQLAQARAQQGAAEASLQQARAQQQQADRDLVRQQDLMARQLVSRQALENAQTLVQTAAAQSAAQAQQVELAKAAVRSAQVQFDYATVHAPFSGVIIAKSAQVGEIVSPFSAGGGFTRTGIGTLVDMDSLEIQVDVNESYINRIVSAQPARAVLDGYPDWTIPAHVIAIIPTADRGKATVKVRVALEVHDARILPDMGARVSFLEAGQKADAAPPAGTLVPASAVRPANGGMAVYVPEDGRARMKPVTLLQDLGDTRRVAGLEAGQRVVADPPAGLVDGARIVAGDLPASAANTATAK